ncbi:hypothetical protein BSZ32_07055 [Rubritalea profundi]|uniref:Uncharacterized protein n=2 Tax=Rubritalea profundi TaxID=1658618 RepID=A0A2S7TZX1_9BACT|nr:hypothetical protein BSZ32_07055 [Rubritalea profundi]
MSTPRAKTKTPMNRNCLALVQIGMKPFFASLLLGFLCCLTVACTTADLHYHPLTSRPSGNWQGSSSRWGGYTETRKSANNYQIGFESYNRPSPEATAYFSLVRAAERAAIDGKKHFYLEPAKVNNSQQVSHFTGYTIPGHCHTHVETVEEILPCGDIIYVDHEITTHTPDTFVPPRDAYNSIFKVSRQLSYTNKLSNPFSSYQILSDASRNARGYGRPKLDPRAHAQMKTWQKQTS